MIEKEPILQIAMLGGFRYEAAGASLTEPLNHSKKMMNLLAYLIIHSNESVSYSQLIDILWPNSNIQSPAGALKTLLYRLRNAMKSNGLPHSQDCILSPKGSYTWNTRIPFEVDVFEFEKLCRNASAPSLPEEEKISILTSALQLYRGEFMPECSLMEWVTPLRTYYQSLFLRSAYRLVQLLYCREDYVGTIDVCRRALAVDPFDETLHVSLLESLLALSKHQDALAHYEFVTNLFYRELGITPSDAIRGLYRKINNTQNDMQTDLTIIQQDLQESGQVRQAFFCEYEFFKKVYRLEARSAARNGSSVYVALLSLTDRKAKHIPVKKLDLEMTRILEVILNSLRKGDVVSRYSSAQYVIMLPMNQQKNGDLVMDRILSSFYRKYPKSSAVLQYKIQPLIPIEA